MTGGGGRPGRVSDLDNERALRKSDVSRQRILDAAARVFRAKGYAGARLTDIAAEAGMQAGSLYYHFDSREELVEELMRVGTVRAQRYVGGRLEAMGEEADPLDRLRAAIEAHLLSVLEISDYTSATIKLIGQVPAETRERVLQGQRAYGGLWRDLLEDAARRGAIRTDVDLSAARMAILGALNWSVEWYQPGRLSPEQLAEDIGTMVLSGLATEAARRRLPKG